MQRSGHSGTGRHAKLSGTVPASTQLRFRQQMQQRQAHQRDSFQKLSYAAPLHGTHLHGNQHSGDKMPGASSANRPAPVAVSASAPKHGPVPSAPTLDTSAYTDEAPPGCSRYTVMLLKPLGIVLAEDGKGGIFVASVTAGGKAAAEGSVSQGDQLLACSGCISTRESMYGEIAVRSGEKIIRINAQSEDFSTVMAAIRSHPAGKHVRLEFQRCQTVPS